MNPVVTPWSDRPPDEYAAPASDEDRLACLRFALTPGFGPRAFQRALAVWGGPQGRPSALLGVSEAEVKREAANLRREGDDAPVHKMLGARDVDPGAHAEWPFLAYCDPGYPPRLRRVAAPPLVLWRAGLEPLYDRPPVAIVGSRRCTAHGRTIAAEMATTFSRAGLQVISGMALGIDGAAHRGALEGGSQTTAVLAHGIDGCFPTLHRDLRKRIERQGTLLTEYPPGTPAHRGHFVQRNRIIAGMSAAVIVVESRTEGGAIRTARFAAEGETAVYAVPADITRTSARGSNALLAEGASPLLDAGTLVEQLLPNSAKSSAGDRGPSAILACLIDGPMPVERLLDTGLTGPQASYAVLLDELVRLQEDGLVEVRAGGRYALTPSGMQRCSASRE